LRSARYFCRGAGEEDRHGPDFEIVTLSNRADLIAGRNALIEVRVPKGVAPNKVRLSLNRP